RRLHGDRRRARRRSVARRHDTGRLWLGTRSISSRVEADAVAAEINNGQNAARKTMTVPNIFAGPHPRFRTRRDLLRHVGNGFGVLALAGLLDQQGLLAAPAADSSAAPINPLAAHPGHFPVKAKSVIWLFMNGGPSQVDTWDYKPELAKRVGKELKGF